LTAANISDTGLHFHDAANPPTDDTTVPPTPPTSGDETVPADIVGVQWVLDGYITVGGLQPLPVADSGAGLTIEADGTVALDGGCNQGSATATFDGQLLQLSDIIATAKACTDEDLTRIESMLFGQLQEQQYWYLEDGTLQLTAAYTSDTGLHFYDAANPPADNTSDTISPPAT
jgi:heat shock protein HslJ